MPTDVTGNGIRFFVGQADVLSLLFWLSATGLHVLSVRWTAGYSGASVGSAGGRGGGGGARRGPLIFCGFPLRLPDRGRTLSLLRLCRAVRAVRVVCGCVLETTCLPLLR